jgi:hypothetical protein
MKYQIRKGVVMEQVCGVYLLISSEEACPPCPYFRPANETMAFYWELLEKGYTEKQLLQAAIEEFDAPEEVLRADLHQLLESFVRLGYLIRKMD